LESLFEFESIDKHKSRLALGGANSVKVRDKTGDVAVDWGEEVLALVIF
jgi:hypothetical protein